MDCKLHRLWERLAEHLNQNPFINNFTTADWMYYCEAPLLLAELSESVSSFESLLKTTSLCLFSFCVHVHV